jgi:hypothetical protein
MSTVRNLRLFRRAVLVAATATATAAVGTGIGMADAAATDTLRPAPVVELTVDSAAIHGPDWLPPGVTTFDSTSSHPGTDSMAVVRLNDGVTYDQIYGYLAVGDLGSVFRHVSGYGGIAHGGTHNGSRWTATLTPGYYLFADDEAHLVAPFTVSGPRQKAQQPKAAGKIRFIDGTFQVPQRFGDGTWQLVNHDRIQHELGFLHVAPGYTQADVENALARGEQPAWITPVGTVNAIGPGQSAWVTLRDIHGFYVIGDWLPMFQGAADGPIIQYRTV